jgi:hypothetical protein
MPRHSTQPLWQRERFRSHWPKPSPIHRPAIIPRPLLAPIDQACAIWVEENIEKYRQDIRHLTQAMVVKPILPVQVLTAKDGSQTAFERPDAFRQGFMARQSSQPMDVIGHHCRSSYRPPPFGFQLLPLPANLCCHFCRRQTTTAILQIGGQKIVRSRLGVAKLTEGSIAADRGVFFASHAPSRGVKPLPLQDTRCNIFAIAHIEAFGSKSRRGFTPRLYCSFSGRRVQRVWMSESTTLVFGSGLSPVFNV